jgi:hypothetical protein
VKDSWETKWGSMTFAHTMFAQRQLPRDICTYNICPEGHLPIKTFAQKDVCPEVICPEDICPEGACPDGRLPRKTFAQKDICPEHIFINSITQSEMFMPKSDNIFWMLDVEL